MDYEKIINLVLQTREIFFSENLRRGVHEKAKADFVTDSDLAVSAYLKKALHDLYPDIGFFCEEEDGALSPCCWILDPIDGTTNYVYGYPLSTVSLALYRDGAVEFGIVYNPYSGECFTAYRGGGAFLNGAPIAVQKRPLEESIIEFGAGSTRKEEAEKSFAIAQALFEKCLDLRRICSSALVLCFIAAGRLDGYFESCLKPWDYAAGSLILHEAGGKTSDYENQALPLAHPTTIVASNGVIHEDILKEIHRVLS